MTDVREPSGHEGHGHMAHHPCMEGAYRSVFIINPGQRRRAFLYHHTRYLCYGSERARLGSFMEKSCIHNAAVDIKLGHVERLSG
jgi:alkyl hydroperoxide reductase subunit AhpC